MPPSPAAVLRNVQRHRGTDRVLELLAFLHAHGKPIRIGDLARALDAPRSSTYEFVRRLMAGDVLEVAGPDGAVYFGKTIYFYGMDYLRARDPVRRARDEVDRLTRETGETSQFCALQGRYYTVVYMAAGTRPFRISSDIGTQIPIPWTASGRLLLSHLSEQDIRAFIQPEDLALPNGRRVGLEDFIASVVQAQAQGYCITSGLVDSFTHCIAAPVRDAKGHVTATLCFVVPADATSRRVVELREILVAAAETLSIDECRSGGRSNHCERGA